METSWRGHGKNEQVLTQKLLPFAPLDARLARMTKNASDNPVILKRMQARAHRGHGAVYKWRYRKHAGVRKGCFQ